MQKKVLKIHPSDNVAVALVDLGVGEFISLNGTDLEMKSKVKAKHKFALQTIGIEEQVIMYGVLVGKATELIKKGEILTTNNVVHKSQKVTKKQKVLIGLYPK